MKVVIAYIPPELLASVKQALIARGRSSMSVKEAQGSGCNDGVCIDPEVLIDANDRKVMRVELGVAERELDEVLDALRAAVRFGREAEVTVYVQEAARAVRIRTSEECAADRHEAVT
ncbi:MAG: nitrogen regulatory protein 2 [Desulfovibrionales bacterium]|jgi:nitrogen regulatory protein PII|nr:nitrogen regulatory protein 2 [Desulfovibrionales bacterium]